MMKKITAPRKSAATATTAEVIPKAVCSLRAGLEPGAMRGCTVPSELRRISSPMNVEIASARKTRKKNKNVVSTVRMAEAIMALKASKAKKGKRVWGRPLK